MLCNSGFSVLLTKIRSLIPEEIWLLSVLKFRFVSSPLLADHFNANKLLPGAGVGLGLGLGTGTRLGTISGSIFVSGLPPSKLILTLVL
jgi:hypothetical protein